MPNDETPAERYRRLGEECLAVARTMTEGEGQTILLEMAKVWQRLADQNADATPAFSRSSAGEQPVMQQQEQVQPKDEDKTS